jgi:hypothetical protein
MQGEGRQSCTVPQESSVASLFGTIGMARLASIAGGVGCAQAVTASGPRHVPHAYAACTGSITQHAHCDTWHALLGHNCVLSLFWQWLQCIHCKASTAQPAWLPAPAVLALLHFVCCVQHSVGGPQGSAIRWPESHELGGPQCFSAWYSGPSFQPRLLCSTHSRAVLVSDSYPRLCCFCTHVAAAGL